MKVQSSSLDDLPLQAVEEIDRICLRFEQVWQDQPGPCFRAFLEEVPPDWRSPLLEQLLHLDLEYREHVGLPLSLQEYVHRYPELAESLQQVFRPVQQHRCSPTMVLDSAEEGQLLGNYRLVRELGRGGMGVVYEAIQLPLGRRVALKMLAPKVRTGTEVQRFRREAEVVSRLEHPHIVPIFEAGQQGDVWYYAMQYVSGQDLQQFLLAMRRLRSKRTSTGQHEVSPAGRQPTTVMAEKGAATEEASQATGQVSFCLSEAAVSGSTDGLVCPWAEEELRGTGYHRRMAEIGLQAAEALAYAHGQGVIHRDIKPTNCLLDQRGRVWLTDFGLVKTQDSDLTSSGALIGTLRYLAPERLRGICDVRADIYSLGLTLYELLTLTSVFADADHLRLLEAISKEEPPRPRLLEGKIPRDLETIVLKAIDKSPERRYAQASELAEDLRCFLQGRPIRARRIGRVERAWRWSKRHPLGAGAIGLFVLSLLLIAGASLWVAHEAVDREKKTKEILEQVRDERDAKQRALLRAEGLRLIAQSEMLRPENPALALLLAIEGATRAPGLLANNALQDALDECREVRVFSGHSGAVFSASLSADSKQVLTCSDDGTARLWDAETGRERHRLRVPHLAQAHFSPDGRRIVTLAGHELYRHFFPGATNWSTFDWNQKGPLVQLWDAATGQTLAQWSPPKPQGVYWFVFHAGAAFSPDSRRVVTFFSIHPDGHALVHEVQTGKQVAVLPGPTPVLGAVFSPDGETVATSHGDHTIRLWQATTGKPLHVLKGHTSGVFGMTFSSEGTQLLSWGSGKKFQIQAEGRVDLLDTVEEVPGRIWDTRTGKQMVGLTWLDADRVPYQQGVFSPDGKHVLLANGKQGRRLWNLATGQPGPPLEPYHPELPWGYRLGGKVRVGHDGATTLYSGLDRIPYVLAGSDLVRLRGHDDQVHQASFSTEGQQILTASADRTARLWRTPNPKVPRLAQGEVWTTPLAVLNPQASRLWVSDPRGLASMLIDTQTGRLVTRIEGVVADAHFDEEGRALILASPGAGANALAEVRRLDEQGRVRATVKGVPGRVLAMSADQQRVLLAEQDLSKANDTAERVWLWDPNRRAKGAELQGLTQRIEQARFAADGRRVITESSTKHHLVHVWDAETGAEWSHLRTAGPYFWWARFLQGGRRILAFHVDEVVFRLYDGSSGKLLRAFTKRTLQPGQLLGLNFATPRLRLVQLSPEERRVLCPGFLNTNQPPTHVVGVWDLDQAGEPRWILKGHQGEITLARFSATGRQILTGSTDRTARLWDGETGQEKAVFRGHEAAVTHGHLDAQERLLVTAAKDQTVRVWEVRTGQELARLRWTYGPVEEVAFTPDGRRVCIRGTSLTRLWDLDILSTARRSAPRKLTAAECERYEIPIEP